MENFIKYLLYSDLGSEWNNIAVLIFRILLMGELIYVHGLKKMKLQNGHTEHIPNPLSLPDKLNHQLAVFSDTIAPVFVILGLGTRFFLLPSIAVTTIGYFVVHRKDSPEVRDVPFIYSIAMIFLLLIGPGSYSLDYYYLLATFFNTY